MAARGLEIQTRPPTVTLVSGLSFVAGPGAWAWGTLSNLDYNDLTSPQRKALFCPSVRAGGAQDAPSAGGMCVTLIMQLDNWISVLP
jgi:hypothetical protein